MINVPNPPAATPESLERSTSPGSGMHVRRSQDFEGHPLFSGLPQDMTIDLIQEPAAAPHGGFLYSHGASHCLPSNLACRRGYKDGDSFLYFRGDGCNPSGAMRGGYPFFPQCLGTLHKKDGSTNLQQAPLSQIFSGSVYNRLYAMRFIATLMKGITTATEEIRGCHGYSKPRGRQQFYPINVSYFQIYK